MPLTSVLLEFSEDPLTDTTPTWVDVSGDLMDIEYWAGVDSEGDDPQPGGAVIRMSNRTRRWEPDYTAGEFYPNVTTHRRFHFTLNDGLGAVEEGLWYVTDLELDYPAGTDMSVVTFTCSDGSEVLALDDVALLDPPDADSYPEVVEYDEPWFYGRLGEPAGNTVISQIRRVWKGKGKRRRRVKRRILRTVTAAELAGQAGPAGAYQNTPTLGVPGLILGDTDTAVLFPLQPAAWARVPIEDPATFVAKNAVSVEVWVKPTTDVGQTFVSGPFRTADSDPIFWLFLAGGTESVSFQIRGLVGTGSNMGSVPVGSITHVVGTFDGQTLSVYINGARQSQASAGGVALAQGDANEFLYIGRSSAGSSYADGVIDEVAVYEHALPAERVLAHYRAGAQRGWPAQTAGARIADIAAHALWDEGAIQTTGRTVQPQMKHGQAKLEEIAELAHAEGPRTMFWFAGYGNPIYLGHEWVATNAVYNTVQATFGDGAGELHYDAIEPLYDNEVYNDVTASKEGGVTVNVTDGSVPRRANTDWTDVLLDSDYDVEALAHAVFDFYSSPQQRFKTITINSADPTRLNHILRREIGHLIRIRKSGEVGDPIDRVTHIIGKRKRWSAQFPQLLTCTWTLARGFNASQGVWRLGMTGFSELNTTAVLA